MSSTERGIRLGTEAIPKLVVSMAAPVIVGFLVNTIYNVVDTAFISQLGKSQAAAATFAFPMFMIIAAMGLMIGQGSGSTISRYLGAGKKKEAEQIVSTAIITAFFVGIAVTIFGVINAEFLLRLSGSTDSNMVYSLDYAVALMAGSVFTILNMTMNNINRGEGSTKNSMYALMFGAFSNIILDPIFMFDFGLNMGIKGAAIATVISQAITTALLFSFYFRNKTMLKFKFSNFTPSLAIYTEIIKIGLPSFFIQILMSVAMTFINFGANVFGDAAVASVGIAYKMNQMGSMMVVGFSQGYQPVAGYNYGARNFDRVKEARAFTLKVTTIFSIVFTAIMMVFATPIITLFNRDPEVVAYGTQAIRALYIMFPVYGYVMVNNFTFQAFGRTGETFALSLCRQGIFLIPLTIIFPKLMGFSGVVLAQPGADFLSLCLTYFLVRNYRKTNDIF